jgi:hypothetical protein
MSSVIFTFSRRVIELSNGVPGPVFIVCSEGPRVLCSETALLDVVVVPPLTRKLLLHEPLIKLVALFSLSSGALLHFTLGNKHDSELGLFRRLWRHLKAGDLFLADRLFCDYVTIAGLWRRNVASLLRLNESRTHDFRQGKRLGPYDRLVTWHKPQRKRKTATRRLHNS